MLCLFLIMLQQNQHKHGAALEAKGGWRLTFKVERSCTGPFLGLVDGNGLVTLMLEFDHGCAVRSLQRCLMVSDGSE